MSKHDFNPKGAYRVIAQSTEWDEQYGPRSYCCEDGFISFGGRVRPNYEYAHDLARKKLDRVQRHNPQTALYYEVVEVHTGRVASIVGLANALRVHRARKAALGDALTRP